MTVLLRESVFGCNTTRTGRFCRYYYPTTYHRWSLRFRRTHTLPYQHGIDGVRGATFIQTRRIGPVGSGLMALQGTSFGFLAAVLAAGFVVKNRGGSPRDCLCHLWCFISRRLCRNFLSRFITKLKSLMNPIVTGCVIITIGLS